MTDEPGGRTTTTGGWAVLRPGAVWSTAPCQVARPAAKTRVTPRDASSTRPATAVHTRCGTAATRARARGMLSLSITEAPRGATSITPYGVYPKGYAAQPHTRANQTESGQARAECARSAT